MTHESANPVLASIAPGWSFAMHAGKLALRYGDVIQPARLRSSDRLWLVRRSAIRFWGGTTEQAIAQLILWIRDQPRRPMRWWEYGCSEHVGLGSGFTLDLLRANGYDDPAKTCCVLCGKADPSDWWALERVIGPCCFGGMCRKEKDNP